jgi:hypothetical protein
MANKSGRPANSNPLIGDGNHLHNEILLRLPQNESEMVLPKLELMRLKVDQVLHEAGDTLKSGYFCNTGMISILTVFRNGESVEVGLVGKEGLAGMPLVAGFTSAANRAVVQVEATALRLDADALVGFFVAALDWSGNSSRFANHGYGGEPACCLQSTSHGGAVGAMAVDVRRPRQRSPLCR